MESTLLIGIFVVFVVIAMGAVFLVKQQAQKVDLTPTTKPGEKPEWMKEMPPAATVATTKSSGVGLYNHQQGERLAAPFAEQIEDIIHSKLATRPELASYKVDLGTGKSGDLQFWVNDQMYETVETIPSEPLRQVIQESIQEWQAH